MIADAERLVSSEEIKPTDVNMEWIDSLKGEIPNCGIIDDMNAPLLAARCNELVDVCNTYAQVCMAFNLAAKKIRKKEQALALYERMNPYFEAKEIKVTDVYRKAFVDVDEASLKWLDVETSWFALARYFENLHDDFRDRHIWYRRIMEAKLNDVRSMKQ
jgi:hypothetical protein